MAGAGRCRSPYREPSRRLGLARRPTGCARDRASPADQPRREPDAARRTAVVRGPGTDATGLDERGTHHPGRSRRARTQPEYEVQPSARRLIARWVRTLIRGASKKMISAAWALLSTPSADSVEPLLALRISADRCGW